jgi:membrane-bound inhibitor of C-type lysozyme
MAENAPDRGGNGATAFWSVNPTQFENSSTLIGMLKIDGINATSTTMELGAFVGNEVRGSAQAIYVAPLQAYIFFLTMYANSGGEPVRFKLYDSSTGAIQDLNEAMTFTADLHQGSIDMPVPFTLIASATNEAEIVQSFEVRPNPFHTETVLRFALAQAQDVTVTVQNVNGQIVSTKHTFANSGLNTMAWKGQSDTGARLAAGVYFVRLRTETGSVVRKVVLEK